MAGVGPLRSSSRSNFGAGPERLGNPVPSRRVKVPKTVQEVIQINLQNPTLPQMNDPNRPRQLSRMDEDQVSTRSRRSNGSRVSVSSSIKKLSGRKDVQLQLLKLKRKQSEIREEFEEQACELELLEQKLLRLQALEIPRSKSNKKTHFAAIAELESVVESKRITIEHARKKLHRRLNDLEGEKESVLEIQRIEDEIADQEQNEEQNLGTIVEEVDAMYDSNLKVQNWCSKTTQLEEVPQKQMSRFLSRQIMKHDLPNFDGRLEDWPVFLSQYTMTTEACHISDVENLQRLQKSLKGQAREVIKSMLVSPNNVSRIMEILRKRYGKPKIILESISRQLEELPSLKDNDSRGLLLFVDAVRNLTSTALAFDCRPFLSNSKLVDILVKKLPGFRLASWNHHLRILGTEFPSLEDFNYWLEEVGDETELSFNPLDFPRDSGRKEWKDDAKKAGKNLSRSGSLCAEVFAANNGKGPEKKCLFCEETGHNVVQCSKFRNEAVDERWNWVKKRRCCFCCLNFGHSSKECKLQKTCGLEECVKTHHKLLHKSKLESSNQNHSESNTVTICTGSVVNLMVVPVKVFGPHKVVETFAMLDTGSTPTLIDSKLVEEVGIRGERKILQFDGISGADPDTESEVIQVKISATSDEEFQLKDVRSIQKLPLPRQSVRRNVLRKWKHLHGLPIETFENAVPRILIGQDNLHLTLPCDVRIGPPNAPAAARTKLGWCLTGRLERTMDQCGSFFVGNQENDDLHELVKKFFTIESLGVKRTENRRSKEDLRAMQIMDETSRRSGD
jgi:hypothetical protein